MEQLEEEPSLALPTRIITPVQHHRSKFLQLPYHPKPTPPHARHQPSHRTKPSASKPAAPAAHQTHQQPQPRAAAPATPLAPGASRGHAPQPASLATRPPHQMPLQSPLQLQQQQQQLRKQQQAQQLHQKTLMLQQQRQAQAQAQARAQAQAQAHASTQPGFAPRPGLAPPGRPTSMDMAAAAERLGMPLPPFKPLTQAQLLKLRTDEHLRLRFDVLKAQKIVRAQKTALQAKLHQGTKPTPPQMSMFKHHQHLLRQAQQRLKEYEDAKRVAAAQPPGLTQAQQAAAYRARLAVARGPQPRTPTGLAPGASPGMPARLRPGESVSAPLLPALPLLTRALVIISTHRFQAWRRRGGAGKSSATQSDRP